MALAAPSNDYITTIRDALVDAGMLSDQIVVLEPDNSTTTDYHSDTDAGAVTTLNKVLGPRAAYIKAEGGNKYSIQFMPGDNDPILRTGLLVRVLEGGKNPVLPHFVFAITETPASSISALTPLVCVTSGTATDPWVE